MKVLAIDTSGAVASAAVADDGTLLGEYILNHKKTHSQKIMVMADELLKNLELTVHDIDLFAAANGPGSFTGLRIGVAAVKALAHAENKPTVGVSPLAGLAYSLPYADGVIIPLMDARADRVYTAAYVWDGGFKELTAPRAATVEDCVSECLKYGGAVFTGDGAVIHREYLTERLGEAARFAPMSVIGQRASSVAAIALEKAKRGETQSYLELKPFYIKKSQAEKDLEKKKQLS